MPAVYAPAVRWEGLFADLEGQLAAEERRELDSEVAERTRRERALVDLTARLAASRGSALAVDLAGGRRIEGTLSDHGDGWLLLAAAAAGRPGAAARCSCRSPAWSLSPGSRRRSERGRDRPPVRARLRAAGPRPRPARPWPCCSRGGGELVGTVDVVGADHLVLAEHPEGEARRRENVRRLVTVPVAALLAVESRG